MGSRWLDPSEVAKGPEMPRCTMYNSTPHARCSYAACEDMGARFAHSSHCHYHRTRGPGPNAAVLPPIPLVAAPRWQGSPPRVPSIQPAATKAYWTGAAYDRGTPTTKQAHKAYAFVDARWNLVSK